MRDIEAFFSMMDSNYASNARGFYYTAWKVLWDAIADKDAHRRRTVLQAPAVF